MVELRSPKENRTNVEQLKGDPVTEKMLVESRTPVTPPQVILVQMYFQKHQLVRHQLSSIQLPTQLECNLSQKQSQLLAPSPELNRNQARCQARGILRRTRSRS